MQDLEAQLGPPAAELVGVHLAAAGIRVVEVAPGQDVDTADTSRLQIGSDLVDGRRRKHVRQCTAARPSVRWTIVSDAPEDCLADDATSPAAPDPIAASHPFVLGGRWFVRPTLASAAPWLILAVAAAVPLRALWIAGGSFDEALVLVLPERLIKGDLPNRDFLHLYGPGSLYALAGWYRVFGTTLVAERIFGLLAHSASLAAVYVLLRPFGRRSATYGALTAMLLVLLPTGAAALAWTTAVALGLWSIVFGLRALNLSGRARVPALLAGGLLLGLSLSFRPDMVVALGLAWGLLWWRHRWSWQPLAGAIVGLTSWWVHLFSVGVGTAWRGAFTDPVVNLRPGRNLPRPPSWGFVDGALQAVNEDPFPSSWWGLPALSASQQLFLWFFALIAVNVGVACFAVWRARRSGMQARMLVLAVTALFGLGLTGQAWQRPDSTHLAAGWMVSAALLPVLAGEWLAGRDLGRTRLARSPRLLAAAPALLVVALFAVVCPYYTFRPYLAAARTSVGNLPSGYEVRNGERTFYVGGEAHRAAVQAAVDDLAAEARAGERLFVGPADLRRTVYNDPYLYHLFPDLTPATYFIELDPGLANAEGSRLAADVASADWVILTNFWTGWFEPNESAEFGSEAPNDVIAERFCLVGNYDDALVLLYRRCAEGDGVQPWSIGIGPLRLAEMEARRAAYSGEG